MANANEMFFDNNLELYQDYNKNEKTILDQNIDL